MNWRLIPLVLGPYRVRSIRVLLVVLADTVLASLGIGLVLPIFQSLLTPQHDIGVLATLLPFSLKLEPGARLQLLAVLTVGFFAIKGAISLWATAATNKFLHELRSHWMLRIGAIYLRGPLRSLTGRKQGELLNDWFNETLAAVRFFQCFLNYVSSLALLLALVGLGLVVQWQVMVGALVLGGLMAALGRHYLFHRSANLSKTKVTLVQGITSQMVEGLSHARELKLMGAEERQLEQLKALCHQLELVLFKGALFGEMPRIMGEFLLVAVLMVSVVITVTVGLSPAPLLPVLMFFLLTFYRLFSAGSAAMGAHVKALNEQHSLELVAEILSRASSCEDLDSGLRLQGIDTDIRMVCIEFGYQSDRKVLKGVSAVVRKGTTNYLVGPSGAGKSTLLDVLMRLESPTIGHIEVNGRTAAEYRLSDWRAAFAYVSQDTSLFNGDIRMNLRLARPEATDVQIEEACHLAGAHDFISTLPRGYDTVVGDRGHSLSGGQRKRIAIARALIGQPVVLILDEATTSFEQSLERELRTALLAALPGLTVIAVTHRLQSVAPDDWVVALQEGSVVATGPWREVQAMQPHWTTEDLEA